MAVKSKNTSKKKGSGKKSTKSSSVSSLSVRPKSAKTLSGKDKSTKSSKRATKKPIKKSKGIFGCCCKKKNAPQNLPKKKVPAQPSLRKRLSQREVRFDPKVDNSLSTSSRNSSNRNPYMAPLAVVKMDKPKKSVEEQKRPSTAKAKTNLSRPSEKGETFEPQPKEHQKGKPKNSTSSSNSKEKKKPKPNQQAGKKKFGQEDNSDEDTILTTTSPNQWKTNEGTSGTIAKVLPSHSNDDTSDMKGKEYGRAEVSIVKKRSKPREMEGEIEMLEFRSKETDRGFHEDITFVTSCGIKGRNTKNLSDKLKKQPEELQPTQDDDGEMDGKHKGKLEPVPKLSDIEEGKFEDAEDEPESPDNTLTTGSTVITPSTTLSETTTVSSSNDKSRSTEVPVRKSSNTMEGDSKKKMSVEKDDGYIGEIAVKNPSNLVSRISRRREKPPDGKLKTVGYKSTTRPSDESSLKSSTEPSELSSELLTDSRIAPLSPTTDNVVDNVFSQLNDRKRLGQLMQVCRAYTQNTDKADQEFLKTINDVLHDAVKENRKKSRKAQPRSRRAKKYVFDEEALLGADGMNRAEQDARNMMAQVAGLMYHFSADCRNDYMTLVQDIYISVYHVRKWLAERDADNLRREIIEATYVMERTRKFHRLLRRFHIHLIQGPQ